MMISLSYNFFFCCQVHHYGGEKSKPAGYNFGLSPNLYNLNKTYCIRFCQEKELFLFKGYGRILLFFF